MKLADRIDNAIVALEQLLDDALRELDRDDLPEEWADALSDADENGQRALIDIGEASDFNEYVDVLQKMLRRIDEHEEQP